MSSEKVKNHLCHCIVSGWRNIVFVVLMVLRFFIDSCYRRSRGTGRWYVYLMIHCLYSLCSISLSRIVIINNIHFWDSHHRYIYDWSNSSFPSTLPVCMTTLLLACRIVMFFYSVLIILLSIWLALYCCCDLLTPHITISNIHIVRPHVVPLFSRSPIITCNLVTMPSWFFVFFMVLHDVACYMQSNTIFFFAQLYLRTIKMYQFLWELWAAFFDVENRCGFAAIKLRRKWQYYGLHSTVNFTSIAMKKTAFKIDIITFNGGF